LAAAWGQLLRLPAAERVALGHAARTRIREQFTLPAIVSAYEGLYDDVVQSVARHPRRPALALEKRRA
jgi:hypothetical protein